MCRLVRSTCRRSPGTASSGRNEVKDIFIFLLFEKLKKNGNRKKIRIIKAIRNIRKKF